MTRDRRLWAVAGVSMIVSAGLALILFILYIAIAQVTPVRGLLVVMFAAWMLVSAGFVMAAYANVGDL